MTEERIQSAAGCEGPATTITSSQRDAVISFYSAVTPQERNSQLKRLTDSPGIRTTLLLSLCFSDSADLRGEGIGRLIVSGAFEELEKVCPVLERDESPLVQRYLEHAKGALHRREQRIQALASRSDLQ